MKYPNFGVPIIAYLLLLLLLACTRVFAQAAAPATARVEANVVYGMYSGLALLMDIHHPQNANGYGIIFIAGSGYQAPMRYDARQLKEDPQMIRMYAKSLVAAGYTVFSINHRAAPRFRYPAALEDAQRAVRYVRHHAGKFRINPDNIGASGGSSGASLVSLLGVLDGKGDPEDPDPVNRQSAKVQCVVLRAGGADLINVPASSQVVNFLGMLLQPPGSVEYKTYQEASPISHVSHDDPPFLLIHGDSDELVPFKHSELMEQALNQSGVAVRLLRIEGGGHGADFHGQGFREEKNWPNYLGEMVHWFDKHLRKQ
jgi:acetyl esterase/lipase